MNVYSLLKKGYEIKSPTGYILRGCPKTGYIECFIDYGDGKQTDGLRSLDKEGTRLALEDIKHFEQTEKEQYNKR